MALDTIDPDSGPFEYVAGSHRWGLLRGEKVRGYLTEEERTRREPATGINQWPTYAERFTTPAIEAEIRSTGTEVKRFLGRKGDVLIWHGRLVHRGSAPRNPSLQRRSLITHYSGVNHRSDMEARERDENGQYYAVFPDPLNEGSLSPSARATPITKPASESAPVNRRGGCLREKSLHHARGLCRALS
jgi:ectoine hydroxylase-related dioxygenase (phytanoyl-CoA dioxygenase family)